MTAPTLAPDQPQTTHPRRRRRLAIIAIALTAVAVVGSTGVYIAGRNAPVTMHGTLDVSDPSDGVIGCDLADSGYADLMPGAQVTIVSAARTTLATGVVSTQRSDGTDGCLLGFTVPNIPAGHALYGVQIGNGNRGTLWESPAQIKRGIQLVISGS
jgi:hypothetical protein